MAAGLWGTDGVFVWMRLLFGIAGPLSLIWFIWKTVEIRSTQSATGILYVQLFLVMSGELLAKYLRVSAGYPAVSRAPEIAFACSGCKAEVVAAPGRARDLRGVRRASRRSTCRKRCASGAPVDACPACGGRQLYVQRDFNQKAGLAVVDRGRGAGPVHALLLEPVRGRAHRRRRSTRCCPRSRSAIAATPTSAGSRGTPRTRRSTSTSPSSTRRTSVPTVPELPDLLYVMGVLRPALVGRTVAAERLTSPVVLRSLVKGDLSLLVGRSLDELLRRAHFVVFRFGDLDLAVNPMLAGRFKLAEPRREDGGRGRRSSSPSSPGPSCATSTTRRWARRTCSPAGAWKGVPGMEGRRARRPVPRVHARALRERLRGRRDQVRAFVMDKRALDSLGNAYADEVLFEAGIHPKTWCRALTHDDAARLHAAIVTVMRAAAEEVERRHEPIEVKVRDFLQIRRKTICPRCGAKVRKAGVRGMDSYFCPRCQPETRPGLVDWRKTGV